MRAVLLFAALALLLSVAQAKFVSVTGQGVLMNPPPTNVLSSPAIIDGVTVNDLDGPRDGQGNLLIGAFNELQGVVLTAPLQLNPTVTLVAGRPYDSHFVFFHQQSSISGSLVNATATFITDNNFVGCTSSDGSGSDGQYEVSTTSFFGLPSVIYPSTTSHNRGFENGDLVVGAGTSFTANNSIMQPGDFVRCISASCIDVDGNDCTCSVTPGDPSVCLSTGAHAYKCFTSVNALISTTDANFSSSCPVQASSLVYSLGSCNLADGCYAQGGEAFCLRASGTSSSVGVHATAGCGCVQDFTLNIPVQSTGNCVPPDFDLPNSCPTTTFDASAPSASAQNLAGNCVCLQAA